MFTFKEAAAVAAKVFFAIALTGIGLITLFFGLMSFGIRLSNWLGV